MEFTKMVMITLYARQQGTQMYRTVFWTLWERARVGRVGRMNPVLWLSWYYKSWRNYEPRRQKRPWDRPMGICRNFGAELWPSIREWNYWELRQLFLALQREEDSWLTFDLHLHVHKWQNDILWEASKSRVSFLLCEDSKVTNVFISELSQNWFGKCFPVSWILFTVLPVYWVPRDSPVGSVLTSLWPHGFLWVKWGITANCCFLHFDPYNSSCGISTFFSTS